MYRFFAFFLSFILFLSPLQVYASENIRNASSVATIDSYISDSIGFISNEINTASDSFLRYFRRGLEFVFGSGNVPEEYTGSNGINNFIDENITINNDNSVVYSPTFLNVFQNVCDDIVDESGYIWVFSIPANRFISYFNSIDEFNKFINFVQDKGIVFTNWGSKPTNLWTLENYIPNLTTDNIYDFSNIHYVKNNSDALNDSQKLNNNVPGFIWNGLDIRLNGSRLVSCYRYSDTLENPLVKDYVPYTLNTNKDDIASYYSTTVSTVNFALYDNGFYLNSSSYANVYAVTHNPSHSMTGDLFKLYYSTNDYVLDVNGISPYYTSSNYQYGYTWVNNYNSTSTNVDNSVTYGDVVTYYDSHDNVTDQDIHDFIVNGGNGSSGGGGGSDSDSPSHIWDWLDRLGEILEGLIEHLGNALVSVIEGIVNIVNLIVDVIPSTIGSILSAIFGWLPEEIILCIEGSIIFGLLFGLIKLIRGS